MGRQGNKGRRLEAVSDEDASRGRMTEGERGGSERRKAEMEKSQVGAKGRKADRGRLGQK